jgi:arsenate reductase
MTEILLSYLAYNIIVGIVLAIIHLVRTNGKMQPQNIAWLILFPAVGLGKWIYARDSESGETILFPEKWFIYNYMIKVNWGYLAIIAVAPVLFMALMFFGVAVGGVFDMSSTNFDSYSGIGALLEAGLVMLLLFGSIIMVFLLAIPYLILIHLPKTQMRMIERQHLFAQQKNQMKSIPKPTQPSQKPISLLRDIHIYVLSLLSEFKTIPSARRKELEEVSTYIKNKLAKGETVNLIFICTHNSRRSQFGQVWAATAAAHYGVRNVNTFSGGTEETAFNKRAVDAIKRVGFKVDGTVGTNPRYSVRFSDEVGSLDCFSKTFDHSANPQKGFAAIMTCSDADENCPIVFGAEFRARITYEDPKISDLTEAETATYDERCAQIATEMLYLFSKV